MKKLLCLFFVLVLCTAMTATVLAGNVTATASSATVRSADTEIAPETEIYWETTLTAALTSSADTSAYRPDETAVAYTKSASEGTVAATSSGYTANPGGQDSLVQKWQELGYLDCIADYYVVTSGYNPQNPKPVTTTYTIYVKSGTDDETKEKIAATLPSGAGVEWKSCQRSYNELAELAGALLREFPEEIAYIQKEASENSVCLGVYLSKSLGDEAYNKAVNAIKKKYAATDVISLNREPEETPDGSCETFAVTAGAFSSAGTDTNARAFLLFGAALLAALLTFGLVFTVRRNRAAVLANGETVSSVSAPSKKEVEESVKMSGEEPSDSVYDNIIKKL